jgi:CheY-like chemotaxis protein
MPDHAALVRDIRSGARYATLPIIITSGDISHKARAAAKRAGVNEYLNKPYSFTLLLQLIARWTGAKS